MSETLTVQSYAERLSDALPRVRGEIARAAASAGRDPGDVRVVAVTKGHPVEAVRAALDAGLTDLGENRVAELAGKVAEVGRGGVTWHMIGHIQRRKVSDLLPVVDWIHAVDSLRLAERIHRLAPEAGPPVNVLIQVNTSGEDAKGGFQGPGALDEILEVAGWSGLNVQGLMTMAPFVDDEGVLRGTFGALRRLLEEVRRQDPRVGPHLSMGMSNDLRFAVEEGSTMVRIGTALFGARPGTAGGA